MIKVGDLELDSGRHALSRNGEPIKLTKLSFRLLEALVQASPDMLSHDEIIDRVWGSNRVVTTENLTQRIKVLRKSLGDDSQNPNYIEGIRGEGYRLIPRAELIDATAVLNHNAITRDRTAAGDALTNSIAVLAFKDMSPEGDQKHMSDGIAEELLNLLARISQLHVTSRSSAFAFRNTDITLPEMAQTLNVNYILEGSVRKAGSQIRITAQLIDARSDVHLWSETYDRELKDIFVIQDEIAAEVVKELKLMLLGNIPRIHETSMEAYKLFLQARYLHEEADTESIARALNLYRAAVEVDPNYAPALLWQAASYCDLAILGDDSVKEMRVLAMQAATKALTADPDYAMARGMMSNVLLLFEQDPVASARYMQSALQLEPANPMLLRWSGILLRELGRPEESYAVMSHLLEQDPVGELTQLNLAVSAMAVGKMEEVYELMSSILRRRPDSEVKGMQVIAMASTGRIDEALRLLKQVEPRGIARKFLPRMYFHLGLETQSRQALDALIQEAATSDDLGLGFEVVATFADIGDHDSAFLWLERLQQLPDFEKKWMLPGNFLMPILDTLSDDPRWLELESRWGNRAEFIKQIEFNMPQL
jgi:adenylate cyclase